MTKQRNANRHVEGEDALEQKACNGPRAPPSFRLLSTGRRGDPARQGAGRPSCSHRLNDQEPRQHRHSAKSTRSRSHALAAGTAEPQSSPAGHPMGPGPAGRSAGAGTPRAQRNSRPRPLPGSRMGPRESGRRHANRPHVVAPPFFSRSKASLTEPPEGERGSHFPKVTGTTTQLLGQAGDRHLTAEPHSAGRRCPQRLKVSFPNRSGATRLPAATMPRRAASLQPETRFSAPPGLPPLPRGCLRSAEAARAPRGPRPAPPAMTQLTVMRGSGGERVRDAAARLEFREAQGPVASFARSLVGSRGHPRGRPVTSPHASTLWARLARRLYNLRGGRGGGRSMRTGGGAGLPGRRPLPPVHPLQQPRAPPHAARRRRALPPARSRPPPPRAPAPPPRHVTRSPARPARRGAGTAALLRGPSRPSTVGGVRGDPARGLDTDVGLTPGF